MADGKVVEKVYGKQKVYVIDQVCVCACVLGVSVQD